MAHSRIRPHRMSLPGLLLCLALSLGACGGGSSTSTTTALGSFEVTAATPLPTDDPVPMGDAVATFTLSHEVDPATLTSTAVAVTENGTPLTATVEAGDDAFTVVVRMAPTKFGATIQVRLLAAIERAADGEPVTDGALNPTSFLIEAGEDVVPGPDPQVDPGRFLPTMTALADGRLVVLGGLGDDGVVRADGEIATPPNGPQPLANAMGTARWAHGTARLSDGRLLVAGGFTDAAGQTATTSAEFYDPATDTFSAAVALATARARFQMISTVDGVPIVLGGLDGLDGVAISNTVEGWDEALGEWAVLDESFPAPIGDALVAPLPDGNLLVAGGVDDNGVVGGAAFIVEPADGDVEPVTAALGTARRGAAAVLLPTGQVLIAGGEAGDGSKLDSLEIFDPETQTFRTLTTASLGQPRSHIQVVVLANGTVALVGGELADGSASNHLETYDPAIERIINVFEMAPGVVGHRAAALPTGALMTTGGAQSSTLPPADMGTWRLFSVAALGSNVPAPRVTAWTPTSTSSGVDVDQVITVYFSRPIDPATISSSSVVITDEEQKQLPGTLAVAGDGLSVSFTADHPLPLWQRIDCEVKTTVTDLLGSTLEDDQARKSWFTTTWDVLIGGADDGSQFGYSARTGDVNGDGIDDIIVSAYVAESVATSGVKEGHVAVIFGKTTWGPSDAPRYRDLASSASAADLTIIGESHLDQPGIEGALQVGDIDKDGYDDIVIGAHFADGPTESETSRGEVWIVFGQASYPQPTVQLGTSPPTGFNLMRIFGAKTGDKFGEGMAIADIDGDTYPDIVVGATGDDGSAGSSTGAMYVVFGDTKAGFGISSGYGEDTAGASAANITNLRIFGVDGNDRLGWSCAAGDIDGDGYADFAGGATGADGLTNSSSSAGEVILVFGDARSVLVPSGTFASYEVGATTLRGITCHGEDAGDFFGWACHIGDLDGDGKADLGVGGTSADGPGNSGDRRGEVMVFFGGTKTQMMLDATTPWRATSPLVPDVFPRGLRVYGGDDKHSFGDAVLFADVDGDGSTDLLIGDFQARGALDKGGTACCWGEVSVLRGSDMIPVDAGTQVEFPLSNDGSTHPGNVTLTRFYGAVKSDRAGTTLAVGDFNDDGRPDLLTGANKARGLGRLFNDSGEAYILWGRATWWR